MLESSDKPGSPGAAMYHLCQVLDRLTHLYDVVAGGYFDYFHAELPTLVQALQQEFTQWFPFIGSDATTDIRPEFPYTDFSIPDIRKTWFLVERPKLQMLKLRLQSSVRIGGDSKLPDKCHMFLRAMDEKIVAYEIERLRFDANQFSSYYQEQQKDEANRGLERNRQFPNEEFEFIENKQVKLTLISFYDELRTTYFSEVVRSPIILSGAIIEALLKEALRLGQTIGEVENLETTFAERNFSDVIDKCFEREILPRDLETQMDAVRNFRNFVHIHRSADFGAQLDSNYKDICKGAMMITITHVREWYRKHGTTGKVPQ